jgi:uncharacterized phage protein gp47/JayE
MPYPRPTLTTIKSQALADINSALPIGGALLQNAILRYVPYAIAGALTDVYNYIDYVSLQATIFTSTDEFLQAWAALKGVFQIPAAPATGQISITGVAGTDVPAGTPFNTPTNAQYVSAYDWTVGSNTALIATATVAGSAGNIDAGTQMVLATSITGVNSAGVASTAFTGGTDTETDDALRTRALLVYQSQPQAGNSTDFENWALQTPGCTRAWVLPLGFGAGSVVVYVMFDISEAANGGFPVGMNGGAYEETRIPYAAGDQLAVAEFIYPLRPATCLVYVASPTAQPINISIQGLNPSSANIQAAISASLTELFYIKGSPLGSTVYISDINNAIETSTGVGVYTLVSPSTNVVIPVGYLPTLGGISYS